jgi:16S rRNA (guanine966-N2)-methyltransferase
VQRIVAGELRGRKLLSLPRRLEGVRPSSARVRSAVFDRLQREVVGARVLDLFAGSGALALEALSRGAAHATMVELKPELGEFLTQQAADLGLEARVAVWTGDALDYLSTRPQQPFDIILVDPPYADRRVYQAAMEAVHAWLAPAGVLVIEHGRERSRDQILTPPARLSLQARREHGDSILEFLQLEQSDV